MIDPYSRDLWTHRSLFVAVALVLIFVRILPLGVEVGTWGWLDWLMRLFVGSDAGTGVLLRVTTGTSDGKWPGPDVLLCLILAWVQRRPDYLPALLIAVVVLTEDFLLMRPPGLWTALVLIGAEFLRSRVALTRELSFGMEWGLIAAVMLGLLLAYRMVFAVFFMPEPGFGFAMVQVVGSILCYPVVVYLSHWALGVHKPAMGEIDDMGRRL